MAEEIPRPQSALDAAASAIADGVYEQIRGMLSALWASRERNKIFALAIALTVIVGATAYAQVRLNAWNQPFYDALAHKSISEFVQQLWVFALLAGALLILNVAQMWLNQTSKVVLRRGLVDDLMTQWMAPSRAFRLSNAGEIGANPDQRIQQDAGHLTDLTTDLGIGLLQSTLLLLSFIGVLWILSDRMVLTINGHSLVLPGYMVWCALIYAGVASIVSWWVGRPLIGLNAEHYAREADFRVAVVRVNEAIDGITLYEGEPDERRRLGAVFESVLGVSWRIVGAVTRLTWVTAGYGWFTIAAPILVAAPAYFRSEMSFGELMMIVGAFNQVQQALRWFVDNFPSIADWRATLLRVASFRKAVLAMDELGHSTSRINFEEGESESILLDKVRVAAPDVCIKLGEPSAELEAGRARAGLRRHRREQSPFFSGDRRALAMGQRPDHLSDPPAHHVRSDPGIRPARIFARGGRLPAFVRQIPERGDRQGDRRRWAGTSDPAFRGARAMGPLADRRGEAAPGHRPHHPAQAAVGGGQ